MPPPRSVTRAQLVQAFGTLGVRLAGQVTSGVYESFRTVAIEPANIRKLMRESHPDRHYAAGCGDRATKRCQEISNAEHLLEKHVWYLVADLFALAPKGGSTVRPSAPFKPVPGSMEEWLDQILRNQKRQGYYETVSTPPPGHRGDPFASWWSAGPGSGPSHIWENIQCNAQHPKSFADIRCEAMPGHTGPHVAHRGSSEFKWVDEPPQGQHKAAGPQCEASAGGRRCEKMPDHFGSHEVDLGSQKFGWTEPPEWFCNEPAPAVTAVGDQQLGKRSCLRQRRHDGSHQTLTDNGRAYSWRVAPEPQSAKQQKPEPKQPLRYHWICGVIRLNVNADISRCWAKEGHKGDHEFLEVPAEICGAEFECFPMGASRAKCVASRHTKDMPHLAIPISQWERPRTAPHFNFEVPKPRKQEKKPKPMKGTAKARFKEIVRFLGQRGCYDDVVANSIYQSLYGASYTARDEEESA